MKITFYFLFGAFGLLGLWFVLTSLLGHFSLAGAPQLFAKACLIAGAVAGIQLLLWAYRLGEVQQQWTKGAGAVVLAVVGFQMVLVLGAVSYSVLAKLQR